MASALPSPAKRYTIIMAVVMHEIGLGPDRQNGGGGRRHRYQHVARGFLMQASKH
jgi:hypothetical protein